MLSRLYGKSILLVEDQEMMRNQLRQSMTIVGCKHLRAVANIQMALEALTTETFDLILSDYNLGENTSGQQFLEYVRTRNLISRNTLFIMITAEQTYQKVMSVAEWTPDDYLLKPFTPAQLNARVDRLIERQEALERINRASDRKRCDLFMTEYDKLLTDHSKFAFDALKIKGEALIKSGRATDAHQHYQTVLLQRPLTWAKVGMARALEAEGDIEGACTRLRDIIAESPMAMPAYDLLARLLANNNKQTEAMEVLDMAGEISPGTLGRLRTLSTLAIGLGQHEMAEKVMSNALKDNKYSPVLDVGDFAMLSRALVNQNKIDAALDVVKNARKGFEDSASTVMLDATESVIYNRAKNTSKATEALDRATAGELTGATLDLAMSVAEALMAAGHQSEAHNLIKQAIQNNPDDVNLTLKVQAVLGGKGDLAAAIIASSRREIIQLNNEGVRKAEAGQFDEAIALLSAAADRLPNNLQIGGNAALALAQYMVRVGVNSERLTQCLRYRNSLAEQSAEDPKLRQIDINLQRLKR